MKSFEIAFLVGRMVRDTVHLCSKSGALQAVLDTSCCVSVNLPERSTHTTVHFTYAISNCKRLYVGKVAMDISVTSRRNGPLFAKRPRNPV